MDSATTRKVSFYKNIKDTRSKEQVPLESLIYGIKGGKWQDQVLKYRTEKDPETKKALPNFTVSGLFNQRKANALIEHSGMIAMDFDDISQDHRKTFIEDPYTWAVFTSVGGYGFCVIVKIDGKVHGDAWNGLANYYRDKYNYLVDASGKDVSRTRFCSYDPEAYLNPESKTFKTKKQPRVKRDVNIASNDDVERLISALVDSQTDITYNYSDWIGLGFFLHDKYGDAGLNHYHALSQFHPQYDPKQLEKKWETFKHGSSSGSKWGVGSLFYLAKQEGINIDRTRTKEVIMTMKVAKKSGSNIEAVNTTFEMTEKPKLTKEEETFWDQVNPEQSDENENQVLKAVAYIRMNYKVFRHEIFGNVWVNNEPLTDIIENGIWLDCQEAGGKVTVQQIHSVLNSPRFPSKDPLRDYIESVQCEGNDAINAVIDSLNAADKEQAKTFMMYWFMATMQNLYSYKVPYCPILVGEQGNGKTYWIRNLMTKELKPYYIEKQLSQSNDDKIQMCHNFIVCNDEFGGSMVRENSSFKQLLSAEKFVLRKAYGRNAEEYPRIASMIATSNEAKVLTDHTGNRRLLPIQINGKINFELYNSVDKARFWGQVYTHWVNKIWPVEMTQEHLDILKIQSDDYYDSNVYEEYIQECFEPDPDAFSSNTEVMMIIQPYLRQQVNMSEIGKAMVKLGYQRARRSSNGKQVRGYKIRAKTDRVQYIDR